MIDTVKSLITDLIFLCNLPSTFLVILIGILFGIVYFQYNKLKNMKKSHGGEILGYKNSLEYRDATVLTTIFPHDQEPHLVLDLQVYSTQVRSVSEAECSLIVDSPIEISLQNQTNIPYKNSANKYVYDLDDHLFQKSSCRNYKKITLNLDKEGLKKNNINSITLSFQHQRTSYEYPLDI